MRVSKVLFLIPLGLLLVTSCAKRVEPGASEAEVEQQQPQLPPPPPPDRPGERIHLRWDSPPEVLFSVNPRYPAQARKDSIEGHVILQIVIDEAGGVLEAEVVVATPPGVFEEAALEAVKMWRFKPATYEGKPIKVRMAQKVEFTLRKR